MISRTGILSFGWLYRWRCYLQPGIIAILLGFSINICCVLPAYAEDMPSTFVRTHLQPEYPVVGQQVEFQIEVFVDTWFKTAPQFPDIQVEDAITLLPASASVNFHKRFGSHSYTGQRRTYSLFPQLPGRYDLPAVSVQVFPVVFGSAQTTPITLVTEPQTVMVQLPPQLAIGAAVPVVATPKLQITETWRTDDKTEIQEDLTLSVGDTLERIVMVRAIDTLGAFLPALDPGDSAGLVAYPDPPQVTNPFERGHFQAMRRDRIVYTAEHPGYYTLPEVSVPWWDTQSRVKTTQILPALSVRVRPTLNQRLQNLLPVCLVLVGLAGGVLRYRSWLTERWQTYRRQRAVSEPVAYRRLRHAWRGEPPQTVWLALQAWLRTTGSPATLMANPSLNQDFLSAIDDPDLVAAIVALERMIYADSQHTNSQLSWSGQSLGKHLKRARKQWLKQQKQALKASSESSETLAGLPPLNP